MFSFCRFPIWLCSIFRYCIHIRRNIHVRITWCTIWFLKCNANWRHTHTETHLETHNPFKWTHFAVWKAVRSFLFLFNWHGTAVCSGKNVRHSNHTMLHLVLTCAGACCNVNEKWREGAIVFPAKRKNNLVPNHFENWLDFIEEGTTTN